MITILPDNEYLKCELVKNQYPDNVFVLTAKDGDEYLGFGAVSMFEDYAYIEDVVTVSGMESLEHGIFKSVLNFVERRSVYDCLCSLDKPGMLIRLGFQQAEKEWADKMSDKNPLMYLNLKGYFEKHC